jgi:hypothetical protein
MCNLTYLQACQLLLQLLHLTHEGSALSEGRTVELHHFQQVALRSSRVQQQQRCSFRHRDCVTCCGLGVGD